MTIDVQLRADIQLESIAISQSEATDRDLERLECDQISFSKFYIELKLGQLEQPVMLRKR